MTDRPSSDVLADLKDFQQWSRAGKGLRLFDYATHHLTVDLAIATTQLLFPEFREVDGYVTIATSESERSIRQTIAGWKRRFGSDRIAIEKLINHLHLCDVLPCLHDASRETLVYFGAFLLRCWKHELLQRFPERKIETQGEWSEEDCDFVFTFFQDRVG